MVASGRSPAWPAYRGSVAHGQALLPGTYTFTAPESSEYLSHADDFALTITPGEASGTPMEFPVTLDGDEIQVDYSVLDEYNSRWRS